MNSRIRLTNPRIQSFTCPEGKGQAFLWDTIAPCLALRATPKRKTFIFEARFSGNTIRTTLGDVASLTIEDARHRANEAKSLVDQGIDPRLEKRRTEERETAERQERARQDMTLGEVWPIYMEERRHAWSANYYSLHERLITAGGQQRTRAKGKTVPGPLASLAAIPISSITADAVKHWLAKEKTTRPTQTRIAFEALRTFLNWCDDDERFKGLASPDACGAKIKRDNLARKAARNDCLEKSQLRAWFKSVTRYESRIMSVYIQTLLLTGARREEAMALEWSDIDFRWGRISIMGKGGIPRDIPLTPYMSALLHSLPRANRWVFSSKTSATGRMQSPTRAFQVMMARAEIEGLTLHGLRRSFSTLAEWLEAPAGIIAQIQGHQPSAIAEKHYKKRPLDLLRVWHLKIERWILEQAGIEQPAEQNEAAPLRLVAGGR